MLKLFVGLDPKEIVGFHVFVNSVLSRTNPNKVSIHPVIGEKGTASNTFNKARFEVPYRCHFNGQAVWLDGSDMLCRTDILELPDLLEGGHDVAVVKHNYSTKHGTKFLGQSNEDYPRKNWSSLMVFDCGNFAWRKITPDYVAKSSASHLHRLEFLKDERIGELDKDWNHLVGEYDYSPTAKIAHFTIGLPCWPAYRDWDYADEWFNERRKLNHFDTGEAESYDDSPLVSER
jgi:hypothetical protein